MHILYITHFFPPKYNAGTENYTFGLAKAFADKGHQVEVVCAEDWDSGKAYWNGVTEDIFYGVRAHRIHLNWTKASNPNRVLYDSVQVERWFDQFLKAMKPDVVHVTSTMSLGIGILRSVHRAGIPLVLTLMDFWFLCPSHQLFHSNGSLCDGKTTASQCQYCLMAGSHLFQRFKKAAATGSIQPRIWGSLAHLSLINRQRGMRGMLLDMTERKRLMPGALSLPDLILAHSKFVQQVFAQHTPARVEVLRNGHDISWQNDYRGKTKSDQLRFGYMGQIQLTKGVHMLIGAFQKAQLAGQARLDIWGDISRNAIYAQQLQKLGGENRSIMLHGRFDRQRLAMIMADIDVLVVPSIWYENAPLVIQEAFAAKTPVIATNLGGMAEAVIHEVNGLLFERGNVDDLTRQLRRIVDEPGLVERLRAGIPPVKAVNEEVTELEEIYHNLTTTRSDIVKPPLEEQYISRRIS
jgi:glycosyltransferase involved in cell wall biosynthesis